MKRTYSNVLVVVATLTLTLDSKSSSYSDNTNIISPHGWSASGVLIPPIIQVASPWLAGSNDEQSVINHFSDKEPTITIDKLNPTAEDFAADLLTVASECLVYSNYELEASALGQSTPPQPFYSSNGWLPRVVFSD